MAELTEKQKRIEALKEKCDEYGITYAPQAGESKLQQLLDAYYKEQEELSGMQNNVTTADVDETEEETSTDEKPLTKAELYEQVKREATKLIRVRITCMDPAFKKRKSDLFKVSNKAIGIVGRCVQFDGKPTHVEQVILDVMRAKRFQMFEEETVQTAFGPRKVKKGRQVPSFAIEVLSPLTEKELKELAADQAARGSIDG